MSDEIVTATAPMPHPLDGEVLGVGEVSGSPRRVTIGHVSGFGSILGHVMALEAAWGLGHELMPPRRQREPEPRMIEHKPRELNRRMARSEAKAKRSDKKHKIKGLRP